MEHLVGAMLTDLEADRLVCKCQTRFSYQKEYHIIQENQLTYINFYKFCKCGIMRNIFKTEHEFLIYDGKKNTFFFHYGEKKYVLDACPNCEGLDAVLFYKMCSQVTEDLCNCSSLEIEFPNAIQANNNGYFFSSAKHPFYVKINRCFRCGNLIKNLAEEVEYCQEPSIEELSYAEILIQRLRQIKNVSELIDLLGRPDEGQFIEEQNNIKKSVKSIIAQNYTFSNLFTSFVFLLTYYSDGEFNGSILLKQKNDSECI
jgi:hypothetical protein